MPWITFQADKEQLQNIFNSIFIEIGGVLYETYSKPNQELKKFESIDKKYRHPLTKPSQTRPELQVKCTPSQTEGVLVTYAAVLS